MIHKTIILPREKAETIKRTAKNFSCGVLSFDVIGNDSARIYIAGDDDDMKALFETIEETIEVWNIGKRN